MRSGRLRRVLAAAFRAGTAATLVARLDPAVVDRYGTTRCTSYFASVRIPTIAYRVVSERGPAAWNWVSDGNMRQRREDTRIRRPTRSPWSAPSGATSRISPHVSNRSGRLRFFVDCGTPL